MNFKKNILIAGLVCAFGVAGAAGFALSNPNNFEAAKAESLTSEMTVYVEVGSYWYAGADSVVEIYAFDDNIGFSTWVDHYNGKSTKLSDNLWKLILPVKTNKFIIVRKDVANKGNGSWTGKYNQTGNIDVDLQKNYYHVTSLNGDNSPYTSGWMNHYQNGDMLYVTVVNEQYDWFSDGAKTTLGFWDGTEITGTVKGFMSGTMQYSSTVSFTVTTNVYTAGLNIYRKSSDLSEQWSQTGNWTFDYANKDMNAFVIRAVTGDAQYYDGEHQSKVYDNSYIAMAYGIHFLNKTNSICYGNEESNNYTSLNGVWTNLKVVAVQYGTSMLGTDELKAEFKTSLEGYTANAFARYSHIIGKYNSLEDFVGGVRASNNPLTIVGANGNSMTAIIILVSVLSLVAAGSFIVIRKKKESK